MATGLPGRAFAARSAPPPARHSRWAKTPTTFGPAGRIVATLLLLVPLAVMIVGGIADPFVWGGAGAYLVIIVPWGLRDIWKAGIVPVH